MVDPLLFDLIHGIGVAPNNPRISPAHKTVQKDRFDLALDEAIKEQVNSVIAKEGLFENKLLTVSLRSSKLEHEIRETASFTDVRNNVSLAVKILQEEGLQYFERVEYDALFESLNEINQHIDALNLKELNDEALQAALTISTSSGRYILKVGIDKYEQGLIEESLAIFFFLTIVNPIEPDYWFRLGLVAKKCENYSLALNSFATSSELAPEFIGAHIYTAYCHLKMHSKENVLAKLTEAKKIQETTQVEEKWRQHIGDIENLLALSNSY
ncbi:MAG: hypothetical protein H0W50_04950 [Parachlamydiaceae bacterium]|nr:hypothetical protein [Parachlamydiaceae bacterium]